MKIILDVMGGDNSPETFVEGAVNAVKEFGCDTDFIKLKEGMSRINVKVKAEVESEINGGGPDISAEALEALYEKLDTLISGDILVLAGSVPKTMPTDIYEKIMAVFDKHDSMSN